MCFYILHGGVSTITSPTGKLPVWDKFVWTILIPSFFHFLSFTGANCSFIIDNNIQNPQSLFLICLDFVAKNICMVESLEGFPDIVGEQLFQKVQENDGFGSDPRNMRIFCEAYGELVLSKLSLSSAHVFTSNYLEYLQLFVCLTELDVSHCRLGDTHELLSYVAHLHK